MGLSEQIEFCVRHPTDTITLYLQSNLHRRKISGFPHTLEWFTGNSTSEQFLVCQITVLLAELLHAAHQGRKGKFQPPHLGRRLKELITMYEFKDTIVEVSVIPCAMYLNQSFSYSPLPIVHLNRFSSRLTYRHQSQAKTRCDYPGFQKRCIYWQNQGQQHGACKFERR